MLNFIITIYTVALLVSSNAFAQFEVPPHWKFKKIQTAHFDIIYNTEQQELGLLYAEKLEKAHDILAYYFSDIPGKTVVIINDKTDFTNGYATRVPYPHIMAYPVLPGPEESLADTGDWAYELLSHEYTHILNFEPATGVMKVVRGIFGTVAAPNILLPTWWKEGLAVHMETRTSSKGRLRSFYQDSVLRAMVEDDSLMSYPLADINEMLPSWPEGMRPYMFGSVMWSEMVKNKGDGIVDKLNQRHSARVPYFLQAVAQDELNRSYDEEYILALRSTESIAKKQLETLKQVPPTIYAEVNFKSKYASAPNISPNGDYLAAITVSQTNSRQIKVFKRNPTANDFLGSEELKVAADLQDIQQPSTVFDTPLTGSIQRLNWFSDSRRFVYDKVDASNRIERYSDLYIYDIHTQKTQALTRRLRAREPAISPDDQLVAFVKLSGGKTELGILNATLRTPAQVLFSAPMQERISYPQFINEHEIIFSLRKVNGPETLQVINIDSKKITPVLNDYPDARFASVDRRPESAAIYFTSSKNGTHNIYRSSLDFKSVSPITHTTTAIFSYAIDPNNQDIYATRMSSGGAKIVTMTRAEVAKTKSELPQIKGLFSERYPAPPVPFESQMPEYKISDYSTLDYLLPRYWIPYFSGSTVSSGILLQAQTSAFDPLKKHSYSISGTWDTGLNSGSIQGVYINQQTTLPMLLSVFERNSYFGTFDNKITDSGTTFAALPDTFFLSRYSALQLGWNYFRRQYLGISNKRTGPYGLITYTDYSRAGVQISPEEGWGGYLGAYNYISQPEYLAHSQFTAGGVVYFSKFLPDRHALMVRLNTLHTPTKIPAVYGVQTEAYSLGSDLLLPTYLLRGYRVGQLLGRNMLSSNIEYRFPVRDIYRGPGMQPFYMHRLSGAVTADFAAADGFFVNDQTSTSNAVSLKKIFSSYGLEAKLETTLGYVIPVSIVFGVYYSPEAAGGASTNVGTNLMIGGF